MTKRRRDPPNKSGEYPRARHYLCEFIRFGRG